MESQSNKRWNWDANQGSLQGLSVTPRQASHYCISHLCFLEEESLAFTGDNL